MLKLNVVNGNSQKLDGGAMFGNVPKALWSQWVSVDDNNQIPLTCRALLIQDEINKKKILLEAGIGAFFNPELKKRYGVVEEEHILINSLRSLGLSDDDIDYVVLSHLHFDHAGGILSKWQEAENPKLIFKNAKYIVSKTAWERANKPHLRDRASFIPELNTLLKESERLIIVNDRHLDILGDAFSFYFSDGHTPGMLMTKIKLPRSEILFVADLIPATPWVHLPITMGYDRYPELLINEKNEVLEEAAGSNLHIFYTHDPEIPLSKITKDERGRFKPAPVLLGSLQ